jgi:hypothetical protein
MRSFKSLFLALLIFIPATAYVGKDTRPGVGLSPGSTAPDIRIDKTGNDLLAGFHGKYLILQFWAVYDAPSRTNNLLMNNSVRAYYSDRVRMVSLSFDPQELVFKETLRTDGIDPKNQLLVAGGEDSEVYKTYRLSKGFTNYLIDPNGVIVAKNITPDQLRKLVK